MAHAGQGTLPFPVRGDGSSTRSQVASKRAGTGRRALEAIVSPGTLWLRWPNGIWTHGEDENTTVLESRKLNSTYIGKSTTSGERGQIQTHSPYDRQNVPAASTGLPGGQVILPAVEPECENNRRKKTRALFPGRMRGKEKRITRLYQH